tara:strand:- start:15029 stop:17011 length:1983 start_codon:yes stop_codon:yes gene_type:complete
MNTRSRVGGHGRGRRWFWVGALALGVWCHTAARADDAADFTREANYDGVVISPSGKYLAVVYRSEGEEFLSVIERVGQKHLSKLGFGERMGIVDVVWANDDRLLVWPSQRFWFLDFEVPTGEIIGVNANGRSKELLFGWRAGESPGAGGSRVRRAERTFGWASLIDVLPEDPDEVLIEVHGFSERGRSSQAVYLNVHNGRQRELTSSPVTEGTFVASSTGGVELSHGRNADDDFVLFHRAGGRGRFEPVVRPAPAGRLLPFAAADDARYFVLDDEDGPTDGVSLWNPTTNEKQALFRHPRVDVRTSLAGWSGRAPFAFGFVDHYPDYFYPDPEHPLAAMHLRVRASFPDDDVIFTSVTRANDLAVALVHGDRNPGTFFLVDVKAGTVGRIQDRRPWLTRERLAKMEPVALTMRDGTAVSGYLTTPNGAAGPGPLVVVVHGGPHQAQDAWGFDEGVQFLAAAGYAVLQVNFRGSAGFGREFEAAGYGEWGGAMQDDVTDATRWAIAEGVADPKRICIYGASYGAYSALTGAFREPELYRCAVGYAGVYDLPLMFREGDLPRTWLGASYLAKTLGTDRAQLESRSPVYNAERIQADVMLVAGEQDERAPIEQSERMRDALKAAGKDVEWIVEKGEGHGFLNPDNRAELYRRLLAFLERSIGR